MSEQELPRQKTHNGSMKTYAIGFILSLCLTLASFAFVWRYIDSGATLFSKNFLMVWIITLALAQLFAQLVFFLHLGRESKPRWNLSVLAFAGIVVIILVFGSLWIMSNLKYHGGHEPLPQNINNDIVQDEGFHYH